MTCEIVADVKVANEALRVYSHFGETYPSAVDLATTGTAVRVVISFNPAEAIEMATALLAGAAKCGWEYAREKMAERAVDLLREVKMARDINEDVHLDSLSVIDDIALFLAEIDASAEVSPENPAPDPYAVPVGKPDPALKPAADSEPDEYPF